MKRNLMRLLASPCCKADLTLAVKESVTDQAGGHEDVVRGILTCTACQAEYPIIAGIPRLCRNLDTGEQAAIADLREIHDPLTRPEPAREGPVDYEALRRLVIARSPRPETDSPYVLNRWENEIDFRVKHCEKQDKVVNTLELHCKQDFDVILDIGAGQGGLIKCLGDTYPSAELIALDYDLSWAEVAKLRNPRATIIRGDAAAIPFRSESIGCIVSSSVLEHVRDYDKALEEMCRVIKDALFLSWGPNKFAVYDFGHLDAPVAIFPRPLADKVALIWHKMRRTGRRPETIPAELDHTFYISTTHVKRVLGMHGTAKNVFADFAMFSLENPYSYHMGGLKHLLARHRRLSEMLFRLLVLLRIEPQCYYILRKTVSSV
jgi:uncharacterized protein YbaR (Trm112 family)/SAM-dependent methyltransferase